MKVYINKITGLDDALVSLLMSKRSWTREKEETIRDDIGDSLGRDGMVIAPTAEFRNWMNKLIKYGLDPEYGHTTLLRYIDISITVDGLHRAGQDDWDAHVARMDNRIVRASTRLGTFAEGEISDYYKGKILFPHEVTELPQEIEKNGTKYVKVPFGYVQKGLEKDKDVVRGLYPESIPSSFIFKVQYPELCHILQMRDSVEGHANPEVQELANEIERQLKEWNPWLGNNVWNLCMQPAGRKAMIEIDKYKDSVRQLAEKILGLKKDSELLEALEDQGVDDWEGYEQALAIARGEQEC